MLNNMQKWFIIVLSVFLVSIGKSIAQSSISAKITGTVTDGLTDLPVEFVTVYLKGSSNAVETDASGRYNINVPAQKPFVLIFTRIGYKESVVNADAMPNGSSRQFDITLAPTTSDIEIEIRSSRIQEAGMVREGVEQLRLLPSTSGNLESLLPHLALGASSGTGGELSSQYNVRGGPRLTYLAPAQWSYPCSELQVFLGYTLRHDTLRMEHTHQVRSSFQS